ncbi:MAG: glycine zipper family protein [Desulfuromonas sp.]|nr:MAG: glycine zipper family protein [Desulfuromonas sp.]
MNCSSKVFCGLIVLLIFTACTPTHDYRVSQDSARPGPVDTEIYFYPLRGQSAAQQDRDRFECYLWARRQTGFDPSLPSLAPHQRIEVVAQPPGGEETLAGAITGAALGAIIGAPHSSGEGALFGAIAGAAFGSALEATRYERVLAESGHIDRLRYAEIDHRARLYRRAMSACLEGRGYSVR